MVSDAPHRPSLRRRGILSVNLVDWIFRRGTLLFAIAVPLVILALVAVLLHTSWPSMQKFGPSFLVGRTWDVNNEVFGILPAIYGTVITSLLALLLAVPIGLGTAIFLAELAPKWLRAPVSFMVELLAAVPSIVYGLWGLFVLRKLLEPTEVWLWQHLGFLPIFRSDSPPVVGLNMLLAGIILAIMILPYITAVSREVILAVPNTQREAALALGATRWETISGPVLRYARSGILGAIILGLGRAIGETMAVTMVIGNTPKISASLFEPGYTLPSLLANEFNESWGMHQSALIYAALVLAIITLLVNIGARLLIWRVSKGMPAGGVQE